MDIHDDTAWLMSKKQTLLILSNLPVTLDERHLSLTRAALHNTSKSRKFYLQMMHKCQYQHMNKHCNLLQRSKLKCNSKGIKLHKYLIDES